MSSCLICGSTPTIKSHLIPRSMAIEVQVGKAHAVTTINEEVVQTQSGIYEQDILCGPCDNHLGKMENAALKAFRKIREVAANYVDGEYKLNNVKGDDIIRFIAGLLWKYSVASVRNGRINLGPYQTLVKDIAFSTNEVPLVIDALLIRLKTHSHDENVFSYRTPMPDRKEGVNGYRLVVGGMFIFVKLDKQSPKKGILKRASFKGKSFLPYAVMRSQNFEEFKLPAKLLNRESRLSRFLAKQDNGV